MKDYQQFNFPIISYVGLIGYLSKMYLAILVRMIYPTTFFMPMKFNPVGVFCVCSFLRTSISCPNYEVVRVVQPGSQPWTVAKSALDYGCPELII